MYQAPGEQMTEFDVKLDANDELNKVIDDILGSINFPGEDEEFELEIEVEEF